MVHTQLQKLLERLGGERRINYALDRFQKALSHVGNPEQNVYTLIISGTNGKGTTSLLISSALIEAGFKVATYLSPHLEHPRERFLYGLEPISEEELTELALEFEATADQFDLTYFEFLTLLNFVWAKRKAVDFLVLEVGLGGRLDATNVTRPLACALTNISQDHAEYLGNRLEDILFEKLAVLPKEGLLFTGIREPALLELVEERCSKLDAIYYYVREMQTSVKRVCWEGQQALISGYPFLLNNPSPGTLENAALSLLLMRIVFPKIPIATIQKAFQKVHNPGRMEIMQENPRVILSGDHNLAGTQCLLKTLRQLPQTKLHTVCGFSADKPYREMFRLCESISEDIVVTPLARMRGQLPEGYAAMGPFHPNATQAVEEAIRNADPDDTVLVTGSLYLVGEVRKIWGRPVSFLKDPLSTRRPSGVRSGVSIAARSQPRESARTSAP